MRSRRLLARRRLLTRLRDALVADAKRLRARIERARTAARRRRPHGSGSQPTSTARSPCATRAPRGKPRIGYPPELPVVAACRGDRRGDPRAPGRHRVRRDRLGQDDAAAEDLPRRRPRRARAHRPHAAAPHRRARRRRRASRRSSARRSARRSATRSASPTSTRPDAYVKLMTDGILLAETQGDRDLARYDTIIIDEAHERSLNIDFLLGYLKRLLARAARPQGHRHVGDDRRRALRATLRNGARARAGHQSVGAHVSGRGALPAARLGRRRGRRRGGARGGDRERRRGPVARRSGRHPRVPARASARSARRPTCCGARSRGDRTRARSRSCRCIARLSVDEQQRVFAPSRGRRIVLATNVAETSLTVPGIRYVIDSGLARVKRYSRAQQDDAAADREDLAGVGEPARRALRPRRERHLRAPLRRGRFRGAARATPIRRSCAPRSPR